MKKYITKQNLIIAILLLLSVLISTLFIFKGPIYKGVDTTYHMSRIIGIANSWKAGNIPAYIHLDETGYGYAMGFFYSNLFFIIPTILYCLGMNILFVYKILVLICGLATAVSMYICVKEITKSKYASTIASVLYTTCGYRIITMVAKGFIGELLSFIFIPIIILGLYQLIFGDSKKWWIFAIGFIGILNSNLVMTEIMIIISAIMIVCNLKTIWKEKQRLKGFLKATFFSLAICAIFWMPMLEQMQKSELEMEVLKNVYQPTKWLVEFKDILFGTIQYNKNLAGAYGLGIVFVILLMFRLKIKETNKLIQFCDISILIGLILMLAMTPYFPWKHLKDIGGLIQFPSRLEIPISAFFSIACGIIVNQITQKRKKFRNILLGFICTWQIIFCFICLVSCEQAIVNWNGVKSKEEIEVTKNFIYFICDGVYLPKGANYKEVQSEVESHENLKRINNTEDRNVEWIKKGLEMEITYSSQKTEESLIEVPLYYYHGYCAESLEDGSKYEIAKSKNGRIAIKIKEKEKDTIKLYYKRTMIQKIGILITSVTILVTIVYGIVKRRRKRNGERKLTTT